MGKIDSKDLQVAQLSEWKVKYEKPTQNIIKVHESESDGGKQGPRYIFEDCQSMG